MKNFSKMRQGLSCVVIAFLLMLIPAGVFAQNSISVSGIVMDDTNEPVIGAAVMVKGTTIGVITDIDGRYTISIPADGILSFSYVGLKDKEEKKTENTGCNISGKLIPIKAERSRVIFPRMFFVFCHKSLISTNSSIFMLKHEK